MLCLSRKVGETLLIAGHIEVIVREIKHNRVILGVKAPASVPVDRLEVHRAKQEISLLKKQAD